MLPNNTRIDTKTAIPTISFQASGLVKTPQMPIMDRSLPTIPLKVGGKASAVKRPPIMRKTNMNIGILLFIYFF